MRTVHFAELLRTVRDRGPTTLRSLVQALEGPLARMFGASACALEVYRPGALYLSRRIAGIDDNGLAALFGIRPGKIDDWTVIDPDSEIRVGPAAEISVASLPFYFEGTEAGRLYLIEGSGRHESLSDGAAALLSEAVSTMIHPCMTGRRSAGGSNGESLRAEILEAAGDDGMMRGLIEGIREREGDEM